MSELLRLNGSLENPPIPYLNEGDVECENDDEADIECVNEITPELLQECYNNQDETSIASSVSNLMP